MHYTIDMIFPYCILLRIGLWFMFLAVLYILMGFDILRAEPVVFFGNSPRDTVVSMVGKAWEKPMEKSWEMVRDQDFSWWKLM